MEAEEDFTAAEVSMEEAAFMAEGLTPAARTFTAGIMVAQVLHGTVARAGMAATTGGMGATTEGIGVIRGTGMDGAGALVLVGRIGVGDTLMATTVTARGITRLRIHTIIRTLVLRAIHVLPTEMMTLRLLTRTQNLEATQQSLGGRR